MDKVTRCHRRCQALSPHGGRVAAEAIMTTDTSPRSAVR